MKEQILSGQEIGLSTGSKVAMARFEGGFALQFMNTIDGIKTEEELTADPTCRCKLVGDTVVTSISLSDEAIDAIVALRDYFKSKDLEVKNAG